MFIAATMDIKMRKTIAVPLAIYIGLVLYSYLFSGAPEVDNSENAKIRRYIEAHQEYAVREMLRTGVPASITLAQGVLESRYGTSELARKANNHFGIKVGGADWTGGRYCVYTKEWNSRKGHMEKRIGCFRVYDSADEGFAHHSDFLRNRPRYAELFELKTTDYEGWAHGLERTGYATDPEYGEKLTSLIDRFELHRFDADAPTVEILEESPLGF